MHYYPNADIDRMTLGEFYSSLNNINKIERWKRGESNDPMRPMSPEEFLEAAKRGEITPEMLEQKKKLDMKHLANQKEFLKKLGIKT